jgi:phosphate/sulfate permease
VIGGTIPCHGAAQLNGKTIKNIITAWVVTVPVAAGLAATFYGFINMLFKH